MPYNWETFTDSAICVVHYALGEAKRRQQTVVGTEHLLVGLLLEDDGKAACALKRHGVTLERVEAEHTQQSVSIKDVEESTTRLTLSKNGKRLLNRALYESRCRSRRLGTTETVDTEHLLLALLCANQTSTGYCLLLAVGVDIVRLRQELLNDLPEPAVSDLPMWILKLNEYIDRSHERHLYVLVAIGIGAIIVFLFSLLCPH